MEEKDLIEYIKQTAQQETKLDLIAQSLSKVDERMTKLEALQESNARQNERIDQILTRLQQGNDHFDKIEARLIKLEMADGKKAKELWKQVTGIFIATIAGAIIGNIGTIIQWLGGK